MFRRFAKKLKFFIAILLAVGFATALATSRQKVCAKYWTENGWSKGYEVETTLIKGSELNRVTRSYSHNSTSTYAVIFWAKDQASVIELSWSQVSFAGTDGQDQQGRKWELSTRSYCY